ncbi:MAG: hypothetical protein K2X87_07680 [Gemmataceae bacterium]|nr:hypothetical protein [Gemmataceae bacterium]
MTHRRGDAPGAVGGLADGRGYFVTVVDDDTIRLAATPGGPAVDIANLAGGGTPIGGLTDGQEYAVLVVDAETIRLTDPATGAVVNLTGPGVGGTHGFERASTATVRDVPVRGLADGEVYYVTVLDANTIRLAEAEGDALAGVALPLDPAGAGADQLLVRVVGVDATGVGVAASAGGKLWTFGLAGAVASDLPPGEAKKQREVQSKSGEAGGVKGTTGFGIAGDVAYNVVTDATGAYLNSPGVVRVGGPLTVAAKNEASIVTAAGSGSFGKPADANVGIAGSFSVNELDLNTAAFVAGADGRDASAAAVTARREGASSPWPPG